MLGISGMLIGTFKADRKVMFTALTAPVATDKILWKEKAASLNRAMFSISIPFKTTKNKRNEYLSSSRWPGHRNIAPHITQLPLWLG